jgi:hypothetical protein
MPRTRLGRLLLAFVALIVLGGSGIVFAMCSAKPGGPTVLAGTPTQRASPTPTMPPLVDGPELAGMM